MEASELEAFAIALAAFLAVLVFALSFPDVRQAIADAPQQPVYGMAYGP